MTDEGQRARWAAAPGSRLSAACVVTPSGTEPAPSLLHRASAVRVPASTLACAFTSAPAAVASPALAACACNRVGGGGEGAGGSGGTERVVQDAAEETSTRFQRPTTSIVTVEWLLRELARTLPASASAPASVSTHRAGAAKASAASNDRNAAPIFSARRSCRLCT